MTPVRSLAALPACVVRWLALVLPLAIAIGSAVALFLWMLDRATRLRFDHPWLLYLLPLAGIGIAVIYQRLGRGSERGNTLVIEEIHAPSDGLPARMAPLILLTTVATHLFGGSAGREGTAVQMGAAIASGANRVFRRPPPELRILLMAGMAAGFGAVFGTPLAGAVFALEVHTVGRMELRALLPMLAAAFAADFTTTAWGIEHTHYAIAATPDGPWGAPLEPWLLAKACLAGAVFGVASRIFVRLSHWLAVAFQRLVRWPLLRPALGGGIVVALVLLAGTRDYLGLGVTAPEAGATTITSSFVGGVPPLAWLWKTVFTAVTLSSGFKGGEVTPLFFIGATLGSSLGELLHAPLDLFAGLGLVSVFGAAANTPFSSTIMGMELFGGSHALYLAASCFSAYLVSGQVGIYAAQRIGRRKPWRRKAPGLV